MYLKYLINIYCRSQQYIFNNSKTNDIHIAISEETESLFDEKWEFIIGGWDGTKSAVREISQLKGK